MTTPWLGVNLLILAMAVESLAQMCLKVGAAGGPKILAAPYKDWAQLNRIAATPAFWITLGILLYSLEILLWTLVLHRLDVSIAFPMGSLCFVGVALLSKIFLGESVSRLRWMGIVLILLGTALLPS